MCNKNITELKSCGVDMSTHRLTLKTKEKGIEGEKVYNFVAKSGDEACEIVGKLKYCSAKLRNKQ